MKSSFLSRSLELAKMTVKIGIKEIQSGNIQSRLEQARILTQSLSQLKGAAMKAGQLLSIELDDYFPPEAAEILSQLQNQGSSISYDVIESILEKELGAEKLKRLSDISRHPIASASIAQIHSATFDQKKLAIKIQHPGVPESIDSDLAIIKKIAVAFCGLTGRQMNLEPMFTEFKNVLTQETDFLQEAKYLTLFQEKLSMLATKTRPKYFVPQYIPSFSTEKVLTMSWEEGITLNQWMRSMPSASQRQQLAQLILDLYHLEFYEWGLVQTDPNFSNFLVRELTDSGTHPAKEPEIGLVLLDFGATRIYDRAFVNNYIQLLKSITDPNSQKIVNTAIEFGILDDRESDESKAYFVEMMKVAAEPFFSTHDFHFSDKDYAVRSKEIIRKFSGSLKYSPPPHQILFLHRKLGGIFSLLKKLEVKMDVRPYWERIIHSV